MGIDTRSLSWAASVIATVDPPLPSLASPAPLRRCDPAPVAVLLCAACGLGGMCYRAHTYAGQRLVATGSWRGGGHIEEYEELYACTTCGTLRRCGLTVKPVKAQKATLIRVTVRQRVRKVRRSANG